MKIHPNGFWENPTAEGHGVDEGLGKAIAKLLREQEATSVCDWGCGNGYYTKVIRDNGIYCVGVDGNPYTKQIAGEEFFVADLTNFEELYNNFGFDYFNWIVCLEVGEHVPPEKEDRFIQNLKSYGYNLILSWAVPGQGGDGHVNCKTNEEVEELMKDTYDRNKYLESILRNSCAIYPVPCYWFRDTLMVFQDKE